MDFAMPSCGGCRTCEMACSFKHTGEFKPAFSSLKVLDKSDGTGFQVRLLEVTSHEGYACDGCPELEEPLCEQFCDKKDDLGEILRQFLGRLRGLASNG